MQLDTSFIRFCVWHSLIRVRVSNIFLRHDKLVFRIDFFFVHLTNLLSIYFRPNRCSNVISSLPIMYSQWPNSVHEHQTIRWCCQHTVMHCRCAFVKMKNVSWFFCLSLLPINVCAEEEIYWKIQSETRTRMNCPRILLTSQTDILHKN